MAENKSKGHLHQIGVLNVKKIENIVYKIKKFRKTLRKSINTIILELLEKTLTFILLKRLTRIQTNLKLVYLHFSISAMILSIIKL